MKATMTDDRRDQWQPIKTAPKNGTPILVCSRSDGIEMAYWCTYEVARWQPVREPFRLVDATHWMPLPKPVSYLAR